MDWMNSLGLIDMGFTGSPYTWSRGQSRDTHIMRRLDRVLCNMEGGFGGQKDLFVIYSVSTQIMVLS